MQEAVFEVDKEKLLEINGKVYANESDLENLIGKKPQHPVYFVELVEIKILHDSPAIGAWEYGPKQSKLQGPFYSLREANKVIAETEAKIDHVSYDFRSKIIGRVLDEIPESGIPVYKYYQEYFEVFSADIAIYRGRAIFLQRYASVEKIKKFSDIIIERAKSKASDYKEKDGKLLAILENGFFNLVLEQEGNHFSIASFSDKQQLGGCFFQDLQKQGIHNDSVAYKCPAEYISLEPLNITFEYDSITDLIKSNDLIC